MKAILTPKGAKRINMLRYANKEVDIANLRTMPWGSRKADVIINGITVARKISVYTKNHGKDCAIIIEGEK